MPCQGGLKKVAVDRRTAVMDVAASFSGVDRNPARRTTEAPASTWTEGAGAIRTSPEFAAGANCSTRGRALGRIAPVAWAAEA